jgi:hypothetical protein
VLSPIRLRRTPCGNVGETRTFLRNRNRQHLKGGDAGAPMQAMAGLGGGSGASDGLNAAGFDTDVSPQQFLTAPQYA